MHGLPYKYKPKKIHQDGYVFYFKQEKLNILYFTMSSNTHYRRISQNISLECSGIF